MTERVTYQDWIDGQEEAFKPIREALKAQVAVLGRIETLVRRGLPRGEAICLRETAKRILQSDLVQAAVRRQQRTWNHERA